MIARNPSNRTTPSRPEGIPTLLGLALAVALIGSACDDGGGQPDAGDPCGGRCLTELGEVCDPVTGTCYFPRDTDADLDAGDVPDDTPGDFTEEIPCELDDDCEPDEFCSESGDCLPGCRTSPDNCDDCDVFPTTCTDGLACHPDDRECVSGCLDDGDCDPTRYCQETTGLCQRGCRLDPDNCPSITRDDSFACSAVSRTCIDGSCTNDDQCVEGSICDSSRCVWGCRTAPDSCGAGLQCSATTRLCNPRPCDCAPSDSAEDCDSLCDDGDTVSGFYCDREVLECAAGCRIRDDGTDNCAIGTTCDDATRECEPGCRSDETCPFGTYCGDEDTCVSGCKLGECDPPTLCDLEDRTCKSETCSVDGDCPDIAYCNAAGNCLEGCRIDDPATTDVDEENCAEGLVCALPVHRCQIASCTADADCPLGQYCDETDSRCRDGCDGSDDRCPVGQPCSDITGFCGCLGDLDCAAGTHCSAPVCVIDCTPDDPATPSVEDSCTEPLLCDPDSGRCVGDCIDSSEEIARNDTPDSATCIMFDEADLADPLQTRLCRAGETHLPPDSYCDGTAGTWCTGAVACTGGDFDWYTMYLYEGDRISFSAEFGQPASTVFVLELSSADNPAVRLRGAAKTSTGVAAVDFVIPETNQYFLRAFSTADRPVEYALEVEVLRAFFCTADAREPANDLPTADAPELANSDTPQTVSGSTICTGDRDFFGVDLFAGNRVKVVVDPPDGYAALQLNLGTANDAETDLDTTTSTPDGTLNIPAAAYDDPDDADDANDVAIDNASEGGEQIPFSDLMFIRVKAADDLTEAPYSLSLTTQRGTASCEDDPFEFNDDPDSQEFNLDSVLTIDDLLPPPVEEDFAQARWRLCPADGGDPDVDYLEVNISNDSGVPNGYLTVWLEQSSDRLKVELLNAARTTVLEGPSTDKITSGQLAAGTYYLRVTDNTAGGALPWYGEPYNLTVRYALALCADDTREPNGDPGSASRLHTTTLVAQGLECTGTGFSDLCAGDQPGGPTLCLCQITPSLVACPADDDWYRFSMLIGDTYSIRVSPSSGSVDDLEVLLYPPDCPTPGDPSCADDVIFFPAVGSARAIEEQIAERPASAECVTPAERIVYDYYLRVRNNGTAGMPYQVLVEIFGNDSRNCPADSWDATIESYPDADEYACSGSNCTLTLDGDNNRRTGHTCFWDQQDLFRFDVDGGDDRRVMVEFIKAEGDVRGTLYRDDDPSPTAVDLVEVADLETRDAKYGDPPGIEGIFEDMTAGTYQLEVYMPGRCGPFVGGSSPNDYEVLISDTICGDAVWSVGEECDPTSFVGNLIMCGPDSACQADCTCSP